MPELALVVTRPTLDAAYTGAISMIDASSISAERILTTPESEPERVFPSDRDAATALFRSLAKLWHPDHSADPRAAEIFGRLLTLHAEALRRIEAGTWQEPNTYRFTDRTDHRHLFKFIARRTFDLGELLLGREWLLYAAAAQDGDLLRRGVSALRGLRFANEEMQRHFAPQLPAEIKIIETAEKAIVVMRRRRDSVRLSDLYRHFGSKVPAEHTAWLTRRLVDLACFLEYNGLAHANLTMESVFVVPATHDIGVYDPWALATRFGDRLVALPQFAIDHLPAAVLRDKLATPSLDVDLIKAMGRTLLGPLAAPSAFADVRNPLRPILAWMAAPAGPSASAEYALWEQAVRASYPKREFVDMHVNLNDIYPERKA